MEYFTAHTFVQRHGWSKLVTFITMLNDGHTLKEISDVIGLSMSQISRYSDTLLQCRYIPKHGTKRYMEEYAEKDHLRGEQKESFILKLVDSK